jgi:hypothetical protein
MAKKTTIAIGYNLAAIAAYCEAYRTPNHIVRAIDAAHWKGELEPNATEYVIIASGDVKADAELAKRVEAAYGDKFEGFIEADAPKPKAKRKAKDAPGEADPFDTPTT